MKKYRLTKQGKIGIGLCVTAVAALLIAIGISSTNQNGGGEIITPSDTSDVISSLTSSSESISGSENSVSNEEVAPTFYLVGTFSEESKWDSREDKLELVDCDDSNVKYQWYYEKMLSSGDEFKITDGSDTWIGFDTIENANYYSLESYGGNVKVTNAGTYSFYLKQYNSGNYSVWINNFEARKLDINNLKLTIYGQWNGEYTDPSTITLKDSESVGNDKSAKVNDIDVTGYTYFKYSCSPTTYRLLLSDDKDYFDSSIFDLENSSFNQYDTCTAINHGIELRSGSDGDTYYFFLIDEWNKIIICSSKTLTVIE